jgi:outer membrane murein-binding lipoprotein Lpp
MKRVLCGLTALAASALLLAGCGPGSPSGGKADAGAKEDKIQANLALLGPEDHKLAEEQKYCAIEQDNRLGSMSAPIKVMVKDQPVFVCCSGCVKTAEADPDKTLADVKDLKAKAAKEASRK